MPEVDCTVAEQCPPGDRSRRPAGERGALGPEARHRQIEGEPLDRRERAEQVDRHDVVNLDVRREGADCGHRLVPGDHNPRLVVFELVTKLAGGVERVVFDDDGAEAEDRVERHDVLRAVRQDDSHAVTGANTEAAKPLRSSIDLVAELGVGGTSTEEFQRGVIAGLGDGMLEHRHQRLRRKLDLGGNARLVILHPVLLVSVRHGHIIP